MTSLRSQAAPLPRYLTQCAAAYAQGHNARAEALFVQVHAEVLPLVRRVVNQHLDKPADKEDAEQVAMLLIWRDAKRGKECVVEQVAFQAAVDVWRKSSVIGNLRSLTPEQRATVTNTEEIDQHHSHQPTPNHADTVANEVDSARFTDTFAREVAQRRPLWGIIARGIAQGLTTAEIAANANRSEGTIRSSLRDMRIYLGVE